MIHRCAVCQSSNVVYLWEEEDLAYCAEHLSRLPFEVTLFCDICQEGENFPDGKPREVLAIWDASHLSPFSVLCQQHAKLWGNEKFNEIPRKQSVLADRALSA